MKTPTKAPSIVLDVCLFGARSCGFGFIAAINNEPVAGDGEPSINRTLTSSLWLACHELRRVCDRRGISTAGATVEVFEPGGERVSTVSLSMPPSFGDLSWRPAPVFVISTEALRAAAGEVVEVPA